MTAKPLFNINEPVFALHQGKTYKAKVLESKIDEETNEWQYFIHYDGWNKKWDTWAQADVLQKRTEKTEELFNKMNVAVKKNDSKKSGISKTVSKRSTVSQSETSSQAQLNVADDSQDSSSTTATSKENNKRVRKRQRTDSVEKLKTFENKVVIEIKLSDETKACLSHDWHLINNEHKLLILPCQPTVEEITNLYRQSKLNKQKSMEAEQTHHFTESIVTYFDTALSTMLLYAVERAQYKEIQESHGIGDKMQSSNVYGILHLLRLMSQLGSILAYSPLEQTEVDFLLVHIDDFNRFLEKNIKTWLNDDHYQNATDGTNPIIQ
ncbi:unnamed protein product [Rotaria magnacalcarata]|uniref:MRG domain-containing protein n=6 Tax=Rotaria magnacalcarata TaxID=392030 RepID=A0A816ZH74_9BILA|nr:unnamed protein product [Rotaria magnacalcarata]CAF2206248.1 unnamed protein product [Rotaria magnacalcarata]CAF4028992.1 unnamed protein product [Rotaria magnacalcarata]CAF4136308.1 unnamed protein product [Rotaria magnacalcarata]